MAGNREVETRSKTGGRTSKLSPLDTARAQEPSWLRLGGTAQQLKVLLLESSTAAQY
jgi:hypothetical protein